MMFKQYPNLVCNIVGIFCSGLLFKEVFHSPFYIATVVRYNFNGTPVVALTVSSVS